MATARQAENVERVRAGLDAFNRGDFDTVLAVLDEEIEIVAPPELMNAGTFHGHDGYRQWLEQWLEAWEDFKIELERIEPVGERHVVAGVNQAARGKGSGIEVEMRIAYLFELREQKTAVMHLHPSWDEAIAAARGRERAPRD